MNTGVANLIPTRRSLLSRLKDWNDQESWKVFFDTYWKLIYNTAIRTGLTDAEAQDVVQEVMVGVSKTMPTFKYREGSGSFKSWLLKLTAWRIHDQLRNREPGANDRTRRPPVATETATIEQMADPAGAELARLWDEEWKSNLLEVALDRVKRKVDPKHYQMFDFYVLKEWPLSRVTKALNVNSASVYLAKHRISVLIKKEIAYLQNKPV
jgi:RNA polymerase sigma factor (sigma-70 family)